MIIGNTTEFSLMNPKVRLFYTSLGFNHDYINNVVENTTGRSIQKQVQSSIDFVLHKRVSVKDEVEKKVLEIDVEVLTKKLEKYGMKKVFEGEIIDSRYDFQNGALRKDGIIIRTRENSEQTHTITIKKHLDMEDEHIDGCAFDYEFEIEIGDMKQVVRSILGLGMRDIPGKRYKKKRISYAGQGMHFDFDKYDDIPWFLEIESDNEEDVNKWIERLGLTRYKTVKFGPKKLKEYYHVDQAA